MKRLICALMCIALLAVSFTGCAKVKELHYDVVLITDGGLVTDGAYNESAWSGVKEYCEEQNLECRYYQPPAEEDTPVTTETALQYIELAVSNGAAMVVLPTDAFEVACYEASHLYPQTCFVLVDGMPHAEGSDVDAFLGNVMTVDFNPLESGFLAGYTAVISGNTNLGYYGSVKSETSSRYGAGFVQGAGYAADELGIPVQLAYADYDSPLLDFDYSFTLTANYDKIENIDENCFIVKVENGTGSGTYTEGSNVAITADPAPEGMVFDHWDYVSNTDGVKDKKVNLSETKKTETNLLVEKCDCTITAVYAEAPETTYPVIVKTADGTADFSAQYIMAGESCNVKAPAAESGYVFDKWQIETANGAEADIDDINAKDTWVHISEEAGGITLTPVYAQSAEPTFDVKVVTGEGGNGESIGAGSYVTDDYIEVAAALPQDGYIFTHWSNADADGYGAGISMENEYSPYTNYTMVNRYQAVVEKMYDNGASVVFAGGNEDIGAVSEATKIYNFPKYAIGSENWQNGWENYYSVAIKDYASAVKACLSDFRGGFNYTGNCANGGIYMSYVDENNQAQYDAVYQALANGNIALTGVAPGADVRLVNNSRCLSLDYWVMVTLEFDLTVE